MNGPDASCSWLLLLAALPAAAAEKPQIDVQELTLANGMQLAALRAPRVAHGGRGLDGARGLGERAARHHRHQPLLRAHDVQGDATSSAPRTSRRTCKHHRRAGEGARADARRARGDAREAARGRDRRPREAGEPDRDATSELDKQFDELVSKQRETIIKDQHGPDLHEERRRVPERLHHRGLDRSTSCACPATASSCGPGWSPTAC